MNYIIIHDDKPPCGESFFRNFPIHKVEENEEEITAYIQLSDINNISGYACIWYITINNKTYNVNGEMINRNKDYIIIKINKKRDKQWLIF